MDKIGKSGIARLIFLVLIIALCASYAVYFAVTLSDHSSGLLESFHTFSNIDYKKSSVHFLMWLFGTGIDAVVIYVLAIISLVVLAAESVISLVPIILLRLIGLRKKTKVSQKEYSISKWIHIGAFVIAVLTGLVLTEFKGIVWIVLFNLVWALFLLIYSSGLKSKRRKPAEPASTDNSVDPSEL